MAVKLIRENSDTPNVSNKDDARMIRYAYGGYNGFVKNRGAELYYKVSGNTLTIQSGVIVLQGWEAEIDSDGWSISASVSDATKRYFTVYCEVNLGAGGTAQIKAQYDTGTFPVISAGDDLTKVANGTARLELYHFITQAGIISSIKRLIGPIEYLVDTVEEINQRLDEMGFKEASVENGEISVNADWSDATPEGSIVKMAKLAVLKKLSLFTHTKVEINYPSGSSARLSASGEIATILEFLYPKEMIQAGASIEYTYFLGVGSAAIPLTRSAPATVTITQEGKITVSASAEIGGGVVSAQYPAKVICSNIGWELP